MGLKAYSFSEPSLGKIVRVAEGVMHEAKRGKEL